MSAQGFALFDTAIGHCGVAWSDRGVVGLQLPEARDADTRSRLHRRFGGAQELPPPPEVAQAIASIRCCAASRSTCPACRSTWRACRCSTAASTRSREALRPGTR